MAQQLAVGERARSTASRHLIHRPKSTLHFLLDPRSAEEERFALAGDMPYEHPLFNDGLEHVHDPQIFVEIARDVGAFIGHRYFRVPLDRVCRFDCVEFAVTAPAAWRVGESPAHMAMDIHASPTTAIGGVPGGLRLRGTMEIDGIAAGTGHADLGFRAPDGHRHHHIISRPWTGARGLGYGPTPADPLEVGRCDPRNVVVSTPVGTGDALSTTLRVDPGHPVFSPDASGYGPGILLIEATRQTSMLAATRAHGFSALHARVSSASVRFRGDAALDLPLTCTARADPDGGDGKPSVRIRSRIEQLDQVVAEAQVTLTLAI